jgi:RimJ/RimL family protein N-acetyltransferase
MDMPDMDMHVLETPRLLLREWRDIDREPFAALNADPEVRRYFDGLMTREQSDEMVDRMQQGLDDRGWGLWAVEVRDGSEVAGPGCIGFVGLNVPSFKAAFTPCVEIGWRLARAAWGVGYAPEAARVVRDLAFDTIGLHEIVSFTAVENQPSRRVMEKIGMHRDPADDFDHPNVAPENPLCHHVMYRLGAHEPRA